MHEFRQRISVVLEHSSSVACKAPGLDRHRHSIACKLVPTDQPSRELSRQNISIDVAAPRPGHLARELSVHQHRERCRTPSKEPTKANRGTCILRTNSWERKDACSNKIAQANHHQVSHREYPFKAGSRLSSSSFSLWFDFLDILL